MRIRNYSRLTTTLDIPNLIDIQKRSYDEFLQMDIPPDKRKNQGLQVVFNSVFPINDINGNLTLEFVKYSFGDSKYTVKECKERDMTYDVPLKLTIRLVIKEGEKDKKKIKEVKEQEIFLCELPLMTEQGTFIINGAQRVIVSQLHRAPGLVFEEDEEKTAVLGKRILVGRLIPYRGSWLEFEFDNNYLLYVRIDRKRKISASVFIRALGFGSNEEILKLFYEAEKLNINETEKKKIIGRILAKDIEISEANKQITEEIYEKIKEKEIKSIEVIKLNEELAHVKQTITMTLAKDTTANEQEALMDIYRKLRPGQPTTMEHVRTFFNGLFFNSKKYDLGRVGRYKINNRIPSETEKRVLTKEDIILTVKELLVKVGRGDDKDDIDHLGNRRVRSAGELVENQFRIGISRMERAIMERMSIMDLEDPMPGLLINTKPIIATIKEFFGSSQLSQFMDQTNPLAELTHKRRLSALGPGGLNRERAGFEVRDVHHTHYGRMCPIETPEGPNIGLIASLSTYARVNDLGFIETPYKKVEKGVVKDTIEYLTADEEDKYVIAQANVEFDEKGRFKNALVSARNKGNFVMVAPEEINYIDVSPMQLVSVATALIPFLEHDDANRALMGSNMQRQAVPLLKTEAPIITTGIEAKVALDSGAVIAARRSGTVEYVDSGKIVIVTEEGKIDTYKLEKFVRTNQNTCLNQKPIVKKGEKVKKGKVLADGGAISNGELALGHNLLVAFMPWTGCNFEDAILISEKLMKDDKFSSIHIEEFQLEARDTKLGREEITRDIPNISEDALKNLDENGIIKIGAEVEPDDILIGKVAPKGETELTPEEKFLRAIFGEKARDVREASLRAPSGIEGKVIDVKVFSRKERESRAKELEKKKKIDKETKKQIELLNKDLREEFKKATQETREKMKEAKNGAEREEIKNAFKKEISWIREKFKSSKAEVELEKQKALEHLEKGDELAPGVIKLVKVRIAKKRKIAVGDKMAGRHGNKGVIARILPIEDMPYLADGTPVDIVLNPLGVPSRMNVGQILETHLGWAAHELGFTVVSPVFDGAKETEVKAVLKEAGLPTSGKIILYDGKTGQSFHQEITTGYIYMMKLLHLVDDKMHARSIGPYSLVTQQPLGGKAQFGGQRFGEMEVWALEAYGAAYTLQEMLTVKSDDVEGRTKVYEAIVKGRNTPESGLPESFNVLIKELQSLGLEVDLMTHTDIEKLDAKTKKSSIFGQSDPTENI